MYKHLDFKINDLKIAKGPVPITNLMDSHMVPGLNPQFAIRNPQCNRRGNSGFTLIELMVVIVILGILAGLIIPRIMGRPEEARQMKAQIQIESMETALKLYKLDNGAYPSTEQGLSALVEPPTTGELPRAWREGGYLEKGKIPKDPWDNEYIYLSPGVHGEYDLVSYGADGEAGGEGKDKDINSWELE